MADGEAPDYQQAKIALVKLINEKRVQNSLEPLKVDPSASAAADAHCQEMVANGFTSHWSLNADKPYQRYHTGGVKDHVSENVVGQDAPDEETFSTDAGFVEKMMKEAQDSFMAEIEPNDLNKQNTLDEKHTHIGIGVACSDKFFRYVEVYLDRYVELDAPIAALEGTEMWVTGKVLDNEYGPYALTVYYDAPSEGISVDDIKGEEYAGGYPDFSDKQVTVTWPWEMQVSEDGSFKIPVTIPELESGQYYFQLYVKKDKANIPYHEHEAGVTVPSADTVCATGYVAGYDGPTIRAGETGEGGVPAPITDLKIVIGEAGAEIPGYEAKTVTNAETEAVEMTIYYKRAEGPDTGEAAPYTDLQLVSGETEEEAVPPDGFEKIEGNFATLTAGEGDEAPPKPFVFLCAKRGDPIEEAPLVDVDIAYGVDAAERYAHALPISIPSTGQPMFFCFQTMFGDEDLDGGELDELGDEEVDPGDVLLEEEEEEAVLEEEGDAEEEMSPEELAEAEARAAEAEERRRVEQRKQDEQQARQAQAEHMRQLLQEARETKDLLNAQNSALQKALVPFLQRKAEGGGQKEEKGNHVENEKRYYDALANVIEERNKLQRAQAQYDRIAMDLQGRLDEKEFKANEIHESFRDFKREIAKGAENSRTGKPIPKKIIQQFEITEAKKDQDVEKVRLKNINLRTHLRKLEHQLRAKEQLAEGLHLIDFEQLKIENQTLNEKIEERNEELHKLRKKTTTTVQVLTHIKEKLQFVQVENQSLKRELAKLDTELTKERDALTKAKRERDSLRGDNSNLKQKQGFVNSDLLVQDFEQRKVDMTQMHTRLIELKDRHESLTVQMQEIQMMIASSQPAGMDGEMGL
jgi:hypothetical protein